MASEEQIAGKFPASYPYTKFLEECEEWDAKHGTVKSIADWHMPRYMLSKVE